jgi:hypothetical protein
MTDHVLFTAEAAGSGRRPLFPGYLLTPLGWAAQPLATIVAVDPRLLPHVFEFNRPRMHLIALALAHLNELRLLARDWQNCLAHYMTQVDDGTCAIYLWDDPLSADSGASRP